MIFKTLTLVTAGAALFLGSHLSPAAEIKVALFGQPCLLDGPFSQIELKSIHAVSPEQLDVGPDRSAAQLKGHIHAALQTLKSSPLPPQLSRYKENYQKRLQAQIEYFDALDELGTSQKNDTLLAVAKRNLSPKTYRTFETQVRSLTHPPSPEALRQLFDTYNEGVEAEPEEEFHRAILAAKVHYTCSFEDHSNKPDSESAE